MTTRGKPRNHGNGDTIGLGAWIGAGAGVGLVLVTASVVGTLVLRGVLTLSTSRRPAARS